MVNLRGEFHQRKEHFTLRKTGTRGKGADCDRDKLPGRGRKIAHFRRRDETMILLAVCIKGGNKDPFGTDMQGRAALGVRGGGNLRGGP